MATKFYLRSTTNGPAATAPGTPPDSGAYYDMLTTSSGTGTFVTNTSNGGVTPPTAETHVTKTAGGTKVTWVSNRLTGFTCSGTITIGEYGIESSTSANARRIWARVGKLDSSGTYTWFSEGITNATELPTSAAAYTATATPTSTVFTNGDRLVCELYLDDVNHSNAKLASGYTVTYTENSGLFCQVNETVTEWDGSNTATVPGTFTCTHAQILAPTVIISKIITVPSPFTCSATKILAPSWPTVTLGANPTGTISDSTPVFYFTGTGSGDLEYEIQVDPANTFDSGSHVIASYATGNYDLDLVLSNLTNVVTRGQSFIGDGTAVSQIKLYIKKVGNPVGNLTAYIYDSENADPDTIPVTLQSTGNSLNIVTDISTSYEEKTLTFSTPFATTNGVTYVLVITSSATPSSSNYLHIQADNGGSSAGNASYLSGGSWTASPTIDLIFSVGGAAGPTLDRKSDVDTADFYHDGADTHPFTSGHEITYTPSGTSTTELASYTPSSPVGIVGICGLGASTDTNQAAGQSFLCNVSGPVSQLKVSLDKIGNPTDTLYIRLRSTSTTGTILASATISCSSLSATPRVEQVTFDSSPSLSQGTTYYLTFERSTTDEENYPGICGQLSGAYSDGDAWHLMNDEWTSLASDAYFIVESVTDFSLDNNTYYWRVRARTGTQGYGPWSSTNSFILSTVTSATVTCTSPITCSADKVLAPTPSGSCITQGSFSTRISTDFDDAWDTPVNFYRTGGYDETFVGHSVSEGGSCNAGWRFQNVRLPNGIIITGAKVTIQTGYCTNLASVHSRIYGEAADNPGIWASGTHQPKSATTTTSYVPWEPNGYITDTSYDTPDFSAVVKEIIDRGGWTIGNALCILAKDNGTTVGDNYLGVDAYSLHPTTCPLLTVTYSYIKVLTASATKVLAPTVTATYGPINTIPLTASATKILSPTISGIANVVGVPLTAKNCKVLAPTVTAQLSITTIPITCSHAKVLAPSIAAASTSAVLTCSHTQILTPGISQSRPVVVLTCSATKILSPTINGTALVTSTILTGKNCKLLSPSVYGVAQITVPTLTCSHAKLLAPSMEQRVNGVPLTASHAKLLSPSISGTSLASSAVLTCQHAKILAPTVSSVTVISAPVLTAQHAKILSPSITGTGNVTAVPITCSHAKILAPAITQVSQFTKTCTINASLAERTTEESTIDGYIFAVNTIDITLNGRVKEIDSALIGLDGYVFAVNEKTVTIDGSIVISVEIPPLTASNCKILISTVSGTSNSIAVPVTCSAAKIINPSITGTAVVTSAILTCSAAKVIAPSISTLVIINAVPLIASAVKIMPPVCYTILLGNITLSGELIGGYPVLTWTEA